jgi:hypothetical protein
MFSHKERDGKRPLLSSLPSTIPYRVSFLPPREEELSFPSSRVQKKKKKERAAQQILKIASEQLFCGFCE